MHDLRLLTLNCWNGRAEPAAIHRLLEERSVDVACFQELAPAQAEAAAAALPYGKLNPRDDFRGMGIALRFPGEVLPISLPRRNAWATDLRPSEWPQLEAQVQVLDVHLQAPHVYPWRSIPLRRRQLDGLEDWLDARPVPHRILAGDLNSTPAWPAYQRLVRRLEDASGSLSEKPPRTWGPGARAPRCLRIDHVLGRGLETLSWEVVRVAGSDHSAVLVDLRLADEEPGTRSLR